LRSYRDTLEQLTWWPTAGGDGHKHFALSDTTGVTNPLRKGGREIITVAGMAGDNRQRRDTWLRIARKNHQPPVFPTLDQFHRRARRRLASAVAPYLAP
jgi:hypothetical protein